MVSVPARKSLKQRGVSLLETLLAVGVAAAFFLFVIAIGRTIAEEQSVQASASYVNQIDAGLEKLMQDPARFNTLYAFLQTSGGIFQASVADFRDGTFAALPASPVLSGTFPDTAPFNQTYRIIFRIGDNIVDPNDNEFIETFIVSETLVPDRMALRIAGALGGKGGVLRDTAVVAGSRMRGTFGGWSTPTDNLGATPWYTVVSAAVPPTLQNGAYVVGYHYFDQKRIANDYLYRKDLGDPTLNRMEGDLGMNNYNVMGVDNITTNEISPPDLDNDGTIDAGEENALYVTGAGSSVINGTSTITGNVQADGPSKALGNVTADNGSLNVASGTLKVTGLATSTNSVFDTLTTKNLETQQLTTQNANMTSGTLDTTNTTSGINASAGTGGLVAGTTDIGSNFESSALNAQNLTVTGGNTGMIYMQTSGGYNQVSGTTSTKTYTGGAQNQIDDPNWRCDDGCN